jgi:hypothetical protein
MTTLDLIRQKRAWDYAKSKLSDKERHVFDRIMLKSTLGGASAAFGSLGASAVLGVPTAGIPIALLMLSETKEIKSTRVGKKFLKLYHNELGKMRKCKLIRKVS